MIDCDWIAFAITYALSAIYCIAYLVGKYKKKKIKRKTYKNV